PCFVSVQWLPSQCANVPLAPTAQTFVAEKPQTEFRSWPLGRESETNALPVQCRIRPWVPTTHMSLGPSPQMPRHSPVGSRGPTCCQPSAVRRRIAPSVPTAHRLVVSVPNML